MNSVHHDLSPQVADSLMDMALAEARKAAARGEIPVGAVLWDGTKVLAQAGNQTEQACDVSAHAEILVLREAGRVKNNWRLEGTVLAVTLEPCAMCYAALQAARVAALIYGASQSEDSRELLPSPRLRVISGIKKKECEHLIQKFFEAQRDKRSE